MIMTNPFQVQTHRRVEDVAFERLADDNFEDLIMIII